MVPNFLACALKLLFKKGKKEVLEVVEDSVVVARMLLPK